MTISFNQIPGNIRVPGAYVEVDSSRANNNLQLNSRILVIGQRLSTGTVAAHVPTLITSYSQAVQAFGRGSMLANMFEVLFRNNTYTEKWCIAVDDNGAGAAAVGRVAIGGTATETGTISLYLGGVLVEVAVASGDDDETVAAAVADAINANLDLPVVAAVIDDDDDNMVSVTYRHKGLVGNKYDMRLNYRGALGGEATPAGITVTLTQVGSTTAGTSDPSLTSALAAIPEEIFDYWIVPYISSGILDALEAELESRQDAQRMLEGYAFTADKGSVSTLSTLGNTRNSQFMSIIDAGENSPTPPYLWAAAYGGRVAFDATNDPARPFRGLKLTGVLAPPPEYRRTMTENNTLLYDGIATHEVAKDGDVAIQRVITTYQENAFGVADGAYLEANTIFTVSYFRQTLRAHITSLFPRHKLADDGTRFGAGQAIVTPKIIKGAIVGLAQQWEAKGLMEDIETFIKDLIVERNADDRNRVDAMIPTNLVNQFHIFAAQIAFIV